MWRLGRYARKQVKKEFPGAEIKFEKVIVPDEGEGTRIHVYTPYKTYVGEKPERSYACMTMTRKIVDEYPSLKWILLNADNIVHTLKEHQTWKHLRNLEANVVDELSGMNLIEMVRDARHSLKSKLLLGDDATVYVHPITFGEMVSDMLFIPAAGFPETKVMNGVVGKLYGCKVISTSIMYPGKVILEGKDGSVLIQKLKNDKI